MSTAAHRGHVRSVCVQPQTNPPRCATVNLSTKPHRVELSRREVGLGILTTAITLPTAAPAFALFGVGGDKGQEYVEETTDLLTTVKNVVTLEREDPKRESDVTKVRSITNTWVAKYRRDNNFAGRPSYTNTYSVVNALSGHFNSFGTEIPLPKKRLERLLKEVDDAERYLSRGHAMSFNFELCFSRDAMMATKRCVRPRLRGQHRPSPHRVTRICAQRLDYKAAGVDIDAGSELVRRIRKLSPEIGGFNGRVPFGDSYLVAGTDGVGTKLKLAFEMEKHDTIGIDLVAMSVNDILTSGARPLFFLDYYATSKLDIDVAEQVVKGIAEGCRQSNCVLLGGETAEMPGFYAEGEYDVAGFAVGAVHKEACIDGKLSLKEGDVLFGLPSSGVHSNGFSLVRKIIENSGASLKDSVAWDPAKTLGDVLLEPTVIYVTQINRLMDRVKIKGMVHVTGGGFPENLPRMVPDELACRIKKSSWTPPPIFQWIQEIGNVEEEEMYRTFNMGIGMVIAVEEKEAEVVKEVDPSARMIGVIVKGQGLIYS